MEDETKRRTVLIPGGARGIGRAIALRLAREGWAVALAYRSSASDAESACEAMRASGAPALALAADVSDPAECERLVSAVRAELGPIDALVNAAGPYHRTPLLEESLEGWHAMFDNNLHPVFYLSRLVAPDMTERGWGRIVNFGLAGADRMVAQPMLTAHYLAKAAVLNLTRTLAQVLGPHGITVNAISPGVIDSGSTPLDELEPLIRRIPAGYVGEVSDAASAALFLLSEEARYVNGTNLYLSGGWGV